MTDRSRPKRGTVVSTFLIQFIFGSLIVFNGTLELQAQSNTISTIQAKVERGITGAYRFKYAGTPLKAKPQLDSDAPIGIRLSTSPSNSQSYEVRFLGIKEGNYDLLALMEHVDGTEVRDLAPILVEIVSMLPKDERSDLFEAAAFQPKVWGGYRLSVCLIGLIWLSIPIVVLVRRSMQAKPIVVAPVVEVPPTFADQLKPLVESAAAGTLSVREKGRLELLLVHYWRERISLQGVDMANAIRQLRSHPEAGQLITKVEKWLHQSESAGTDLDGSPSSIVELLKPYRGSAVIDTHRSQTT